jgi:hypothetical protein
MAMGTHTIQILSSQSNFVLLMKVLKAISILVIGPILGILVAFFLGVLALPADPNFVANGGHAAPGDGFLTMGLIFLAYRFGSTISHNGRICTVSKTEESGFKKSFDLDGRCLVPSQI